MSGFYARRLPNTFEVVTESQAFKCQTVARVLTVNTLYCRLRKRVVSEPITLPTLGQATIEFPNFTVTTARSLENEVARFCCALKLPRSTEVSNVTERDPNVIRLGEKCCTYFRRSKMERRLCISSVDSVISVDESLGACSCVEHSDSVDSEHVE